MGLDSLLIDEHGNDWEVLGLLMRGVPRLLPGTLQGHARRERDVLEDQVGLVLVAGALDYPEQGACLLRPVDDVLGGQGVPEPAVEGH